MLSKTDALEFLRHVLEQLCDEHGYLADVVMDDVRAWGENMLEEHLASEEESNPDAESHDEAHEG